MGWLESAARWWRSALRWVMWPCDSVSATVEVDVSVPMIEGSYPARAWYELHVCEYSFGFRRRWRECVVYVPGGIPCSGDDSIPKLYEVRGRTLDDAIANAVFRVVETRAARGWSPGMGCRSPAGVQSTTDVRS